MALANVALTDTFDYWRTVTNSMVVAINDKLVYCNTSNANTVSIPSFVSRSSNLYVNIITSTSVYDAASGNVASALSVNTTNELARSYSLASNGWSNTVGTSGNTYLSILAANNAVGANNWANTKLSNTSGVVFNGKLGVNTAPTAFLSVYGNSSDTANGVANFLTPVIATGYNFIAVGRDVSSPNSAIYGFANTSTPYGFMGVWGAGIGSGTLNITQNGNVGVGTATPAYKLDVAGDINGSGGAYITGSVGIGVTPIVDKFVVKTATNIDFGIGNNISVSGALCLQAYNDTRSQNVPMEFRANSFYFTGTTGNPPISITSAGSVGIGTQSPATTLDVVGTVSIAKASVLNQTLTDAATINWDTSLGQVAYVTLGGNRTMAAPSNLKVGTYILHVIQDGSGGRTLSWNSVFKWTAGIAPVLTSPANRRDVFSFISDGTNLYGSYLPDVR